MTNEDDDALYLCSENIDVLWKNGENGQNTFGWVSNHFLKANVEKYYLVLSSDESFSINIDNVSLRTVTTKNCQKLI